MNYRSLLQRYLILWLLLALLLQGCLPARIEDPQPPEAFPLPATEPRSMADGSEYPYVYQIGKGAVRDLQYSPDSEYLAVAAASTLTIFASQSMEEVKTLVFPGEILAVRWSPEGRTLSIGFSESYIELWDTETWQKKSVSIAFCAPLDLDWNHDGTLLAATRGSGLLAVYDVASGEMLYSAAKSADKVVWAPDRNHLFIMDFYDPFGTKILDVDTLSLNSTNLFNNHADVHNAARWIASAQGEAIVMMIQGSDQAGAHFLASTTDPETGIKTSVFTSDTFMFDLSPSADKLILTSSAGELIVHSATGGEIEAEIPAHSGLITALDWSASGESVASAGGDGVLKIWDPETWEVVWSGAGYLPSMHNLAFIDSTTLVGGSISSGNLFVLNPYTGELVEMLSTSLESIAFLAVAPDRTRFIAAGNERFEDAGNWTSRPALHMYAIDGELLDREAYAVSGLCWPQEGETFYSWNGVEAARWRVSGESISHTGTADLLDLALDQSQPHVAWSGDCAQLVIANQEMVLVSTGDGDQNTVSYDTEDWLSIAAWSPDQSKLAAGDAKGVVTLMDDRGQVEASYPVLKSGTYMNYIIWSPDGNLMAAANMKNQIAVFNPNDGQVWSQLFLPGVVNAVTWSEDGHILVLALSDGTILLWPLDHLTAAVQGDAQ